MKSFGMQAVVAQTGFGAALGIELIARGIWKDEGVFSPEYFPSQAFYGTHERNGTCIRNTGAVE